MITSSLSSTSTHLSLSLFSSTLPLPLLSTSILPPSPASPTPTNKLSGTLLHLPGTIISHSPNITLISILLRLPSGLHKILIYSSTTNEPIITYSLAYEAKSISLIKVNEEWRIAVASGVGIEVFTFYLNKEKVEGGTGVAICYDKGKRHALKKHIVSHPRDSSRLPLTLNI
ncbi:hypothetical protein TL16_g01795 [Triparma laevis f. inornata]|uniref:Uncharacterized protein n=1 Tax=Triparma laevis f. inornata TaxID=1714386 RepID=A0A9W6ZIG6_9STRA|nr:hypothetical protein TL16_g01795 [Triparma laevis f. inornata]